MNASHSAQGPYPSEGESFKTVLPPAWRMLHPDILRCSGQNRLPDNPLHYTGMMDAFLAQGAAGVALFGLRDAAAAFRLKRIKKEMDNMAPISFCDAAQSVLVTGATGFIGQRLVRALLKDGHQVTVLTRRPEQAASMFDGKVRCIASMTDLPASCRIDVIINLAGARILGPRWTDKRKTELRQSRIGVTKSVVDWIAKATHKPALLLSGSAIGYYGIQDIGDQTVLDETAASQPMFMSDLCREWEDAAKAAAAHGVRVECMRFGLVLGRQGALPLMLMPILLGVGGRLGSGRQWLSWIHVEDVLGGIAHLWKQAEMDPVPGARTLGHIGVSNFTAPECVSQKTFSETAARIWKRPCFFPTPGGPVRLALGEQADLLLEGQRVFPARLQREGFLFRYPELAQALQSLK